MECNQQNWSDLAKAILLWETRKYLGNPSNSSLFQNSMLQNVLETLHKFFQPLKANSTTLNAIDG